MCFMSYVIQCATGCVILFSCGQLQTAEPRFDQDPELTVERIFQRWDDAAEGINVVDIRVRRFSYNMAYETCEVSAGRFYCRKDVGYHLKLDDASASQKNVDSRYEIRPASSELWVSRGNAILDIDLKTHEARKVVWQLDKEVATVDTGSWFWSSCVASYRNSDNLLITLGHGSVPKLLRENFDVTVAESKGSLVLRCSPRSREAGKWCSSVWLLFKNNSPVPSAVQIIDPAKTKTTVYVITSHSFNGIAADEERLLQPDLAGFKVHTIASNMPAK